MDPNREITNLPPRTLPSLPSETKIEPKTGTTEEQVTKSTREILLGTPPTQQGSVQKQKWSFFRALKELPKQIDAFIKFNFTSAKETDLATAKRISQTIQKIRSDFGTLQKQSKEILDEEGRLAKKSMSEKMPNEERLEAYKNFLQVQKELINKMTDEVNKLKVEGENASHLGEAHREFAVFKKFPDEIKQMTNQLEYLKKRGSSAENLCKIEEALLNYSQAPKWENFVKIQEKMRDFGAGLKIAMKNDPVLKEKKELKKFNPDKLWTSQELQLFVAVAFPGLKPQLTRLLECTANARNDRVVNFKGATKQELLPLMKDYEKQSNKIDKLEEHLKLMHTSTFKGGVARFFARFSGGEEAIRKELESLKEMKNNTFSDIQVFINKISPEELNNYNRSIVNDEAKNSLLGTFRNAVALTMEKDIENLYSKLIDPNQTKEAIKQEIQQLNEKYEKMGYMQNFVPKGFIKTGLISKFSFLNPKIFKPENRGFLERLGNFEESLKPKPSPSINIQREPSIIPPPPITTHVPPPSITNVPPPITQVPPPIINLPKEEIVKQPPVEELKKPEVVETKDRMEQQEEVVPFRDQMAAALEKKQREKAQKQDGNLLNTLHQLIKPEGVSVSEKKTEELVIPPPLTSKSDVKETEVSSVKEQEGAAPLPSVWNLSSISQIIPLASNTLQKVTQSISSHFQEIKESIVGEKKEILPSSVDTKPSTEFPEATAEILRSVGEWDYEEEGVPEGENLEQPTTPVLSETISHEIPTEIPPPLTGAPVTPSQFAPPPPPPSSLFAPPPPPSNIPPPPSTKMPKEKATQGGDLLEQIRAGRKLKPKSEQPLPPKTEPEEETLMSQLSKGLGMRRGAVEESIDEGLTESEIEGVREQEKSNITPSSPPLSETIIPPPSNIPPPLSNIPPPLSDIPPHPPTGTFPPPPPLSDIPPPLTDTGSSLPPPPPLTSPTAPSKTVPPSVDTNKPSATKKTFQEQIAEKKLKTAQKDTRYDDYLKDIKDGKTNFGRLTEKDLLGLKEEQKEKLIEAQFERYEQLLENKSMKLDDIPESDFNKFSSNQRFALNVAAKKAPPFVTDENKENIVERSEDEWEP